MKGMILSLGATSVALAMLMTGCASTSGSADSVQAQARKELSDFIVGSRNAENIEKTNDKAIDALASSSTIIYKRVGGAMREYIITVHGDLAVLAFARSKFLEEGVSEEDGIKQAGETLKKLAEEVQKNWTPEKLYQVAREKHALECYLQYKKTKNVENIKNKYKKDLFDKGEEIYKKSKLSKKNWEAEQAWLNKAGEDVAQMGKNLIDLATGLTEKITAKTNDLAILMKDPAMQKFMTEVSQIKTKMKFANEAKKQELLAEIAALAASADYKPLLDKQKLYGEELELLKKNLSVLQNGIGKQLEYTGKAIPWLISEYMSLMEM